jgi:hypothetical protein
LKPKRGKWDAPFTTGKKSAHIAVARLFDDHALTKFGVADPLPGDEFGRLLYQESLA